VGLPCPLWVLHVHVGCWLPQLLPGSGRYLYYRGYLRLPGWFGDPRAHFARTPHIYPICTLPPATLPRLPFDYRFSPVPRFIYHGCYYIPVSLRRFPCLPGHLGSPLLLWTVDYGIAGPHARTDVTAVDVCGSAIIPAVYPLPALPRTHAHAHYTPHHARCLTRTHTGALPLFTYHPPPHAYPTHTSRYRRGRRQNLRRRPALRVGHRRAAVT